MRKRKPRLSRKAGLVGLLKSMKPLREKFPEIHDSVPARQQLKKSLRSKRATGCRVGKITEDDKHGGGDA